MPVLYRSGRVLRQRQAAQSCPDSACFMVARDLDPCGGTLMRCVNRLLAGVLIVPALTLTPAMAQEGANFGQSLAKGPMTAWCEPGQALLSGGYELQGAEPPAADTTTGEDASAAPPVVFVASSRPTVRLDRNGDIAQFGW